jgi:hypothetical protein
MRLSHEMYQATEQVRSLIPNEKIDCEWECCTISLFQSQSRPEQ